MHRPILANQKTQQYINAEIMAVEKEELLSKLKEWGVDFETERPKNWAIFRTKREDYSPEEMEPPGSYLRQLFGFYY